MRRNLIPFHAPAATLAALLTIAACEPRTTPIDEPAPPVGASDREERVRRPIMIEGMADTLEFRLVRAPRDFGLPFSTYLPADMGVDFTTHDDTDVVHFTAEFGGVRQERARLSIYVHPPGTLVDHAHGELSGYLSGLYPDDQPIVRDEAWEGGSPVEPASRYPWAQHESRFTVPLPDGSGMLTGRAGVGEHGDRVFHFIIEYPAEFGDGMGPRIAAIWDEWRWEDTGTMLGEGAAGG